MSRFEYTNLDALATRNQLTKLRYKPAWPKKKSFGKEEDPIITKGYLLAVVPTEKYISRSFELEKWKQLFTQYPTYGNVVLFKCPARIESKVRSEYHPPKGASFTDQGITITFETNRVHCFAAVNEKKNSLLKVGSYKPSDYIYITLRSFLYQPTRGQAAKLLELPDSRE